MLAGYHADFSKEQSLLKNSKILRSGDDDNSVWQLLLKLDSSRNRKIKLCIYEAKNRIGDRVFVGCNSSSSKNTYRPIQEALMEAVLKARS